MKKGWSKKDMSFPSQTAKSWLELVFQPKPLTDRSTCLYITRRNLSADLTAFLVWNNIYPKLVRLLKINRAFHEEEDKQMRLHARRKALAGLIFDIEAALPPIVRVTLHAQTSDLSTTTESIDSGKWSEDRTLSLGMPFPLPSDVGSWRVVEDLLEPDVSADEMQPEMAARREEIEREIVYWQDGYYRRASDLLHNGRPELTKEHLNKTGSSASSLKPIKRAGKRRSARRKPDFLPGDEDS